MRLSGKKAFLRFEGRLYRRGKDGKALRPATVKEQKSFGNKIRG